MRKSPVRRILLSVVGTVSTVVLMLALKPHTSPDDHIAAAPQAPASTSAAPSPSGSTSPSASASASPSGSAKPSPKPDGTEPSASSPAQDKPSATEPAQTEEPAAPQTRTVTGSAVSTKYGTVQVRITLSGDRITASAAIQCPSSTPRSKDICGEAVPTLNAATVSAQSADIATVSGATYTSDGYRSSLQSALDKA